jgi:hypothetical protein
MASVPFAYECDRDSAFAPDTNSHKRSGFITELDGFGLAQPLTPDLTVSVPYSGQPRYSGITVAPPGAGGLPRSASVVGVLENFTWAGGGGDAIKLDFWCSQEHGTTMRALQQFTLATTKLKALGWWIVDYDQVNKQWFEQSYPASAAAITGSIAAKGSPGLNVGPEPVPVKAGIGVNLYKVSISVVPAANQQYALLFASSAERSIVKSWGLPAGTPTAAPA